MVGDRFPTGESDDTNTFFKDVEIADLLDAAGNDINVAALAGWYAKAAEFAKFVDRDESGSSRKMSQMFKNAEMMIKHYESITTAFGAVSARAAVARIAVWGDESCRNRVMASSATFRGLREPSERARFLRENPETAEADSSYPASTPQGG